MDYKELEQRANILVAKVNAYEADLEEVTIDEGSVLNQHLYADTYSIRPVMKMLFGATIDDKTSRTLANDKKLQMFASSAPAWNSSFDARGLLVDPENPEVVNVSDVSLIGDDVQLDDGILSDFTTSSYARIEDAFSPSTNTFEFVINFTTGNDVLTGQTILSANDSVAGSVAYNMVDGNLTGLLSSRSDGSWDIASNEVILALSTNTEYTIKLEFTGSSYIYSSLENGSYVVKKTITSSSNVYSGLQLVLGNNRGSNNAFLGTINLNNCYININDERFWTGAENKFGSKTVQTTFYENINRVGNPTIENGILSNCGPNDYIEFLRGIPAESSYPFTWFPSSEFITKIKIKDLEVGAYQGIFGYVSPGRTTSTYTGGIYLGDNGDPVKIIAQYYDATNWYAYDIQSSVTFSEDTEIWLNYYSTDGSNWYLDYSTDGSNWVHLGSLYSYSGHVSITTPYASLGYGDHTTSWDKGFKGEIDLNNTVLKQRNGSTIYWKYESYNIRREVYEESGSERDMDFISDQHEFMNNLDMYNANNMLQLDVMQETLGEASDRESQGISYAYSANIQDALATESQVANLFRWNTTDSSRILNNSISCGRQVPGVVLYYLGQGYDGEYAANVPYSMLRLNSVNYSDYPLYGSKYNKINTNHSQELGHGGHEALRLFIPGLTYSRGRLGSAMQIWQPDNDISKGFIYQGKALYHELIFKNRRAQSYNNNVDFIPGSSSVPDNDPQGLAIRAILAQQKDYYYNRPWFNELDDLYGADMSKLADKIIESSIVESESSTANYTEVGEPTISDDYILSDISTSNYVELDCDADTTTGFKVDFNFTITDTISSNQPIISSKSDKSFEFGANSSGLFLELSSDGSAYDEHDNTFVALNEDEEYKCSITWNILTGDTPNFSIVLKKASDDSIVRSTTVSSTAGVLNQFESGLNIGINTAASAAASELSIDLNTVKVYDSEGELLNEAVTTTSSQRYMTDAEFFSSYKLDYNTYADALDQIK